MNPQRILYYGPRLTIGGAAFVMIDVSNALSDRGLEVHLLQPEHTDSVAEQKLDPRVVVHRIPTVHNMVLRGPLRRFAQKVMQLWQIRRVVRCEKIDCVLADIRSSIYQVCLLRVLHLLNTPIVTRCGTPLSSKFPLLPFPRIEKIKARAFFRLADKVIVPSEMVGGDLHRTIGLKKELLAVIPNRIDHQTLSESSKRSDHPESRKVIIAVGELSVRKDIRLLLSAVRSLSCREPGGSGGDNWVVWLVGDGPDRGQLETLVDRYELRRNVKFWGRQENPWSLMAQADVLVATSRADGFMLAVAEALALGTPVILPTWGVGIIEYLSGLTFGRQFEPGCATSLAEAIAAELACPTRITDETRQAVLDMFSDDRLASSYQRVLEDVCA